MGSTGWQHLWPPSHPRERSDCHPLKATLALLSRPAGPRPAAGAVLTRGSAAPLRLPTGGAGEQAPGPLLLTTPASSRTWFILSPLPRLLPALQVSSRQGHPARDTPHCSWDPNSLLDSRRVLERNLSPKGAVSEMSSGLRALMSLLMLVPGETVHARVRGQPRGTGRECKPNGDTEQGGPGISLKARTIQDLGSWGLGRGWGQRLRNDGFRGCRSRG